MRLMGWMQRFYGVATKYMNNYLYWFFMFDKHKNIEEDQINEQFLYASNRFAGPAVSPLPWRVRLLGTA